VPRRLTEQERDDFLSGVHVAVISVAREGGEPPLAVPLWYGYQRGGNFTFFTGTQGRKARKTELIRKAGVVSLTVQQESFPYRYVAVAGTVIGADAPPSEEQMLGIVRRYLPEDAARGFVQAELALPDSPLTLFTVQPDRWDTADFSEG
jgi:nitroimidazol reductase NimA-like FMN-containing flavoprotein (pyridoxamine 5'-phosphate oxidase superfamily)